MSFQQALYNGSQRVYAACQPRLRACAVVYVVHDCIMLPAYDVVQHISLPLIEAKAPPEHQHKYDASKPCVRCY